jgi:serine/threonine protein kinase
MSRDAAIRQIDTLLSLPPHPYVTPLLVAFSPRPYWPRETAGKLSLYLAFERYPATLTDLTLFKKLPLDVKFNVIAGILSGLSSLNDNGLQHGHLRPGSMAFGAFGHPLLLDYGLAPLHRCRVSESDDLAAFMGLLGQLLGSQAAISGKWSTTLEAFGWFAVPEGRSWLGLVSKCE